MIKGPVLIKLRYCCPCDAAEVLNVQGACHMEEGEDVFLQKCRHLYREARFEIKKHEREARDAILGTHKGGPS